MLNKPNIQEKYVPIAGTELSRPKQICKGKPNPNQQHSVIILGNLGAWIDELQNAGKIITIEELEQYEAIESDFAEAVGLFAKQRDLIIAKNVKGQSSITIEGTIADLERAFQVNISEYSDANGNTFLGREGFIYVPESLSPGICAVFGLDSRPEVAPHSYFRNQQAFNLTTGYSPKDVAHTYRFPKNVDGTGECIAIIEFGGGYLDSDLSSYFKSLDLPLPDVSWIGVDGATNSPTHRESYDKEVTMNIQISGAIANGAKIRVYFAPNTETGFFNALTSIIYDKVNRPSVISISWGAPENKWLRSSLLAINNLFKIASVLGISICAATGNKGIVNGIDDGCYHVDFPASSPYVLACGGTRLVMKHQKRISELPWYVSLSIGAGGGVSEIFPLPKYQENIGVPISKNKSAFKGRGLPDVAGNADPKTGYHTLIHGIPMIIGGTSAVAPLLAGFIALTNQQKNKRSGQIHDHIYLNAGCCRPVNVKNFNTSYMPVYQLQEGWDACTGLGVLQSLYTKI